MLSLLGKRILGTPFLALEMLKASLTNWVRADAKDQLAHIRDIHERLRGEYGRPRMHKELLARGLRMGKEPGAAAAWTGSPLHRRKRLPNTP
ncbi:hypothetical protein J2X16_002774 [Pelomonas aquatica]|uniref:HTH-like domain-containing protein n=1 Tax=Pelomonas aquatica TaxID=431058 RepID=A0ABU1Z9X6_9BURK|nr:IS3 family transposase [Pelomonas aquatica]MDR7297425.1 hypothetical protein [Pelomonas aquatica]